MHRWVGFVLLLGACGEASPPVTVGSAPPAPVAAPVPSAPSADEVPLAIPAAGAAPVAAPSTTPVTPPTAEELSHLQVAAVPSAVPQAAVAGGTASAGAPAGAAWCCEYDGPLGKTQDLIDNPAACAARYAAYQPTFVSGAVCEPVCCRYARDAADVSRGYAFDTVAAGNCTLRGGSVVELDAGQRCQDPSRPSTPRMRPRPAPAPPPRVPPPAPSNPFRPK
jgi:hypothetical protein